MGRACSTYVTEYEYIQSFGGKAKRNEPLGEPNEMELRVIGWYDMN
jgi:hypothetical protein